jgi:Tol biopolymer transport system component
MEALFPPEILPKVTQGRQAFTFSFEAALKHIALRRDHPGMPPKIVEEGVDLLPTGMSATPLPSSTSTPLPTFTPTPAPDLLTCQDRSQPTEAPQPARLIYTDGNDVWQWEETGGKKMQIPLPDGATAPLVSDDGQWIAFLKQGQAYDTPDSPVASIPLFLLNRQSGQVHRVASFETTETRQLYSLSPYISLDMHWLPGGHFLLVQIYPRPWGEGTLQPTGDLYLLDADTSSPQLLLKGGEYAYYSFRPDGKGIAALSTAGMQAGETFDYNRIQEGTLHLMSVPLDSGIRDLELRLTENPWTISAPKYSPDGYHIVLQVETGLAVVDIGREQVLQIPIVNPCATAGCYWGGPFVISWFPDGQSFYTLTSINDHFDTRAETTLHLIRLEPDLTVETAQIIHAAPWSFSFSPDLRILSYWNQPDLDTPGADLNRVTLYLMDLQSGQSKRYQAQYELRVTGWSPDNQRFLYLYSPVGGPNLVTDHLALGSICQPPQGLPVPEGMLIDHVRWLDPARFLAWTTPASGIPDHYTTGLYLYSLAGEGQPVHIDNQAMDMLAPYGMQAQVLVVEQ